MKKAISLGLALLLLFTTLSGCSSPKSNFTSTLRQFSLNEQYTLNVQTTMNEFVNHGQNALFKNLEKGDSLSAKVSIDEKQKTTFADVNVYKSRVPFHFEALQNNKTGRVYIPVNTLYELNEDSKQVFGKDGQEILDFVLAHNTALKAKYLDFYETAQNLLGFTINQVAAEKQANEIRRLEKETLQVLYDFLNQMDESDFKQEKGRKISLQLDKQDLSELASEVMQVWDKDDAAVRLLSTGKEISKTEAKRIWSDLKKTSKAEMKKLVAAKDENLSVQLTLVQDADSKFKDLKIRTLRTTAGNETLTDFSIDIEALPFEVVQKMPEENKIVNKKELDKAISDGLKKYLETTR
ncbi:hypothetical protein ACRW9N_09995 [Listeria aquatica]|uniref:Lmo2079 family surface lipoprotein n=1 Tax=Listeria aquatica TaxID=1494960 RepID=UPI003EF5D169